MKKSEILKLSDAELNKKVKIQGTKFDRKRKINSSLSTKMEKMLSKGKTAKEVAKKFNVTTYTVKYNTDPEFNAYERERKRHMSGRRDNPNNVTVADRVAYKRKLVMAGAKLIID